MLVRVDSYRWGLRSDCQGYVTMSTYHLDTCHHARKANPLRRRVLQPEEAIVVVERLKNSKTYHDVKLCHVCKPTVHRAGANMPDHGEASRGA